MLLDVKPWDDETDMAKLEASVRAIHMDGLLWGACESGGEWADGRMGGWCCPGGRMGAAAKGWQAKQCLRVEDGVVGEEEAVGGDMMMMTMMGNGV